MSGYVSYVYNQLSAVCRVMQDKYYDSNVNSTEDRLYPKIDTYEQNMVSMGPMTHIVDNVYLGSAYNAGNHENLQENKIEIIINVTKEINNYFPKDYKYYKFPICDNNEESIDEHIKDIYKIITENHDRNILIHCFMGASRSATAVIYYLMIQHKMSCDDAIKFVKEKRSTINPSKSFVRTLMQYDTTKTNTEKDISTQCQEKIDATYSAKMSSSIELLPFHC